MGLYTSAGLVAVCLLVTVYTVSACNEAVCAALVSKCMLIKCCECDMTDKKNCTCCQDCQICLSNKYFECCSCVGLCPKPDNDDDLHMTSSVEDLTDPIPALFDVLTQTEDSAKRWTTYTYPIHYDIAFYKPGSLEYTLNGMGTKFGSEENEFKTENVTVAFMAPCMPLRKCKQTCRSMGAARYRWFHEHGCCQCIGHRYDYGMSEARCIKCPTDEDEEFDQDKYDDETVEFEMEEKAIDG